MSEAARCTVKGQASEPDTPAGVPTKETLPDGQAADHYVLCEAERAKGYVRPVRRSYKHVGVRPCFPTRALTSEQAERTAGEGYVAFEPYPESEHPALGRFWTEAQLSSGCGTVTSMPEACAETYARDPSFYGSTFCCGCGKYLPVGARGEFVWLDDGTRVGT
jgi:hypothetical protein